MASARVGGVTESPPTRLLYESPNGRDGPGSAEKLAELLDGGSAPSRGDRCDAPSLGVAPEGEPTLRELRRDGQPVNLGRMLMDERGVNLPGFPVPAMLVRELAVRHGIEDRRSARVRA